MLSNRLERICFPVRKVELDVNGKKEYHIVDDRSGYTLSVVSERYTLVDNRSIITPFVEKFGEPSKIISYANRKSYLFEFTTGRDFDLGGGDIIKERIVVANSYDKTKAYSFIFGVLRMVCTNGLYSAVSSVINFHKKHVGDIPVRDQVDKVLNNYQQNDFNFWKRLKSVPLNIDDEKNLITKWTPFEAKLDEYGQSPTIAVNNAIKNRALSLVSRADSIDNQRNGWGLFNAMNGSMAQHFGGYYRRNNDIMTPKTILGNKRAEEYLKESLKV